MCIKTNHYNGQCYCLLLINICINTPNRRNSLTLFLSRLDLCTVDVSCDGKNSRPEMFSFHRFIDQCDQKKFRISGKNPYRMRCFTSYHTEASRHYVQIFRSAVRSLGMTTNFLNIRYFCAKRSGNSQNLTENVFSISAPFANHHYEF